MANFSIFSTPEVAVTKRNADDKIFEPVGSATVENTQVKQTDPTIEITLETGKASSKPVKKAGPMTAKKLARFLTYLETDITSDDKKLFINNLVNAKHTLQSFRKHFEFTKSERNEFIHSDYKAIWKKQQPQPKVHDLRGWFNLEQCFEKHIEQYAKGNEEDVAMINEAMLTHRIKQNSSLKGLEPTKQRDIFFKELQGHYQQQAMAIERIFEMAQTIEGSDFLTEKETTTISVIDYKRWIDETTHQEIAANDGKDNFYKINGNHLAHSDIVEKRSLQMRLGLTALSVALSAAAVFSGDPTSMTANATSAVGQTTESCDTLTSFVNAILFAKNHQPGLAMLNLSIGTGRMTSQALAISVLIAPTLFGATTTASFGFLTPACSLAMAGLYQYRMHQTQEKLGILQATIDRVNDKIKLLSTTDIESIQAHYNQYIPQINAKSAKIHMLETHLARLIDRHQKQVKKNKKATWKLRKNEDKQSLEDSKASINELKQQIKIEKKAKRTLVKAQNTPPGFENNPELKQLMTSRRTLEKTIEAEIAAYNDYKKNRNLWLKIAVVTTTIALVGIFIASSTSTLGLLPLALGICFAIYSIIKEYSISGKNSATETLDDVSSHSDDFDFIINNADLIHQKNHIDLNASYELKNTKLSAQPQKLSVLNYLQDIRRTAPKKADAITKAMKKLAVMEKYESTDSTAPMLYERPEYIQAKSELLQAAAISRRDLGLAAKETKGYKLFSAIFGEKTVGLHYLKKHKETLLKDHAINFDTEIKFKNIGNKKNLSFLEFLENLSRSKPCATQAIVTEIYKVINTSDPEDKHNARTALIERLKPYTDSPNVIANHIHDVTKHEEDLTDTESAFSDGEESTSSIGSP